MTTPTTEAGRRLYGDLTDPNGYRGDSLHAIIAIETEARAEALREAEERVRALARDGRRDYDYVDTTAVLAILDPETGP